MIQSMTSQERSHPDLLNESRMRRISKGSGRALQEVKDLYERFKVVRGMMGGLGAMMGGGGMPAMAGGGGFPGFMGGGRAQRRLSGMSSEAPTLSAEEKIRRAKEKKEQRKERKANRRKR